MKSRLCVVCRNKIYWGILIDMQILYKKNISQPWSKSLLLEFQTLCCLQKLSQCYIITPGCTLGYYVRFLKQHRTLNSCSNLYNYLTYIATPSNDKATAFLKLLLTVTHVFFSVYLFVCVSFCLCICVSSQMLLIT